MSKWFTNNSVDFTQISCEKSIDLSVAFRLIWDVIDWLKVIISNEVADHSHKQENHRIQST